MEFWNKLSTVLKQKGFSTTQIKKLQEVFGHLDAAGLLRLSPDQLLPAMTGRTVTEKREKIETLLSVAREVQAQLGGQPSPSRGNFTITGLIRTTDGQPLANVTVRAFERGIGRETALGDALTDAVGKYEITIPPENFITLEQTRPHLVVHAYTKRNKLLGTSEIIFNANSGRTVDLKVENIEEAPLSTYETLAAKLRSLLGEQQLADLADGDTKILAVEASGDLKQVEWLRQSTRLARTTRLPAETLYALASQRLPLELEKLLAQSDKKIQAALEAALEQNVIPAMPESFMDGVLARFEELRLEQGLLLQHEITGQLQNQETEKPLAGFTVRIVDLSAQPRDREPGLTSTDQAGEFSITYTARPRSQATRSFRLHILDRQGKELHSTEVTAQPGQAKLDAPISIQLPPIERPSPRITELATTLRLDLAPELSTALERHKVATLDDIRRTGGLDRLKDAAVGSDDPAVKRLQAHADLNVLSDDVKVNDALIDKGYDSIYAVSRKTRRDFTKDMQASIGEEQAIRLNDVARKQALFLDNLATMHGVDRANGYLNNSATTDDYPDLEPPCHCRECESAASPLAYLTDLLDYAVRHVNVGDNSIDLTFLENSFHQPFGDLPVSCASGEEKVRQVRLAVEVLRSILDETNLEPSITQHLLSANRHYCMAAYESLLLQIGTSYDELRLVRRGTREEKQALAERLAIAQIGNVSVDYVVKPLWLDQDKHFPDLKALNEINLERLFGLPTTDAQSRFSKGAKRGDEQHQISDWQLDGLAWRRNTDVEGRVHLRLTKSGNDVLARLYRNQARHETSLVASGSRTGNNGRVSLGEENLSGLSGTLTVQYKETSHSIVIALIPRLLSMRFLYLRQQWRASKKPQHASPFGAPPVIDPDLVGPDDFRHPEPGNPAFDIWLARRNWVDDLLKELRSQTKTAADGQVVPDVRKMLDVMEDTGWQATTIADLEALDDLIQQATDLDAATSQLGRLFLSKASFRRMMDIKAKADRREINSSEAVTDDEWEEFYSILVQSLKQAMGSAWRTQERVISDTLRSLEYFWLAVREPVEGQWPPLRPLGQPWIDPDTVKEDDLPDSVAGDQARTFLQDRRSELMAVNEQLQATREAHGLEALLVQALGATPARSSWENVLNRLHENHLSSNAATADAARDRIANLRITETEFGLLMTVKTKDKAGETDSAQAPKPEEWASIYTLLTRVKKERVKFPQWRAAETRLAYWNFRKARLTRWRATMEARQDWLEELQSTAKLPVIDPDLVDIPDFMTPFSADKAFGQWQERASELDTLKQAITDVTAANDLEKIDKLLTTYLGVKADRLEALVETANEGNLTTARLQQLTVSLAELDFLFRVRALASQDSTSSAVIDEEWDDLYDILVQVEKRRKLFPKWRSEERNHGLVLSPDHFKLRQPEPFAVAPPPPQNPLNTWRATASDRRDWEKTLKARIEQQDSIMQALRGAVSATEEATLTDLRNDLIGVLNEPDKALAVAAKEMSERLLIDMSNSGCHMTTRAGQAMVTIQQLLWSLRTDQLKAAWPTLSLDAEEFDEEWKWLGSYATWRAAMMVFLYPENILLPSLRRQQTPAFRQVVKQFQLAGRVTPEDACRAANQYADYFRDVCNLALKATCSADYFPNGGTATCGKDDKELSLSKEVVLFLFAQGKVSESVYMSILDPSKQDERFQSYWEKVPGLDDVHVSKIIGAVNYELSEKESYVYLFLQIAESAQGQEVKYELAYLRYDLNKTIEPWDKEITRLEIKTPPVNPGVAVMPGASKLNPWVAVLCQNRSKHKPPLITIQHDSLSPKHIYCNYLDSAGKELRHEYWLQWPSLRSQVSNDNPGRFKDSRYYRLVGLCEHTVKRGNATPLPGYIFLFQEAFPIEGGYLFSVTNRVAAFCDITSPKSYQSASIEDPYADVYRQNFDLETIAPSTYSSNLFAGMHASLPSGDIWVFLKEKGSKSHVYATLDYRMIEPAAGAYPGVLTHGKFFYHVLTTVPKQPSHLLGNIAFYGGISTGEGVQITVQRTDAKGGERTRNGLFFVRCDQNIAKGILSSSVSATRIAPHVLQDEPISVGWDKLTPLTELQLVSRRAFTNLALLYSYGNDQLHYNNSASTIARDYIEEAYFALPLFIARSLARADLFVHAYEWFRNIYNFNEPLNDYRKIWRGLSQGQEENYIPSYVREMQWLVDPINPHRIVRKHANTRFVVISIVQTLLAHADAEYTLDTSESNARARSLYSQALELLDIPELRQELNNCEQVIGELSIHIGRLPQIELREASQTFELLDGATLDHTATTIRSILDEDEAQETKAERVRGILHAAKRDASERISLSQNLNRRHLTVVKAHRALLANPELSRHPNEYVQSSTLESASLMSWLPSAFSFCIPPNPILRALRFHAELNLYKLRTCRNIAGMERELEPYSAPTDVASGLPAIGAGGQLTLPGVFNILPTQYRYRVLADRAKQLTDIARQMESTFLSFLVEGDAGRYNVLKARQDARLTRAGVRLQDLRIQEAHQGKTLAQLQKDLSEIQYEHYSDLIAAGALDEEVWALNLLWASMAFQFGVGAVRGVALIAAGLSADISASGATFGTGSLIGAISSAALDAQIFSAISGGLGKWSSALSMAASQKRKKEDWRFQLSLANQNTRISDQQIIISESRIRITGQEHAISRIQADHADDIVEFLNTKFTNVDLYDWMSGVMEGVYRYFLQQSTGIARLAENQLAFERQEMPPSFIQADYWDALRDGSSISTDNGNVTDRRGLTGSARLLQDLTRLDQYAFETDKRKLQLTKTISLARLDPLAFQQFRETGIMVFATPMTLFDHDFPGHYLRLIKRVRTSVIALIPPMEGIKATLAITGISRVVIGGDLFQTTIVNRGPESVALTSPQNATGLFELEMQGQGEMLLPFEGLGVDTTWEFRLPKPANAFDFRTIADVLITIEYTALDSPTYRQQVIQQLDRSVSADRPFSFRHQFADAWYDLHHPDLVQDPQQPMAVPFTTRREDFPPNVTDLEIDHVTLYIARKSNTTLEFDLDLKFIPLGSTESKGGAARTVDGIASTRKGNAAAWTADMIRKSPIGKWTLAFKDEEEVRDLFANDQIEDILFVITFGGETPAWPQ